MNITDFLIILINAIAIAISFSCISGVTVIGFSKNNINFIRAVCIFFAVYLFASFVFIFVGIPLLAFSLFLYLCYRKIPFVKNIICCIVSTLAFILVMITMNVINYMIGFSSAQMLSLRDYLPYNIFNSIMCMVLSLLISCIVHLTMSKSIKPNRLAENVSKPNSMTYIILLNLIFIILILSVTEFTAVIVNADTTKYIMIFGLLFAGMFILFSATSLWLMSKIMAQKAREVEVQKNKELTELYKTEMSRMYNDMRDFKHDYMKIFNSMSTLIANGDITKLRDYYEKEVVPLKQEILFSDSATHTITNISDSIIHGLIYSYVIKAKNNKINFIIDIQESIPKDETMASLDMCRVLGVLLDNAFEAAAKAETHNVVFGAVNTSEHIIYVIKNTYADVPDIPKLMHPHHSSKYDEHGRGLNIVHKIISQHKSVNMSMELKNEYFVCELVI